jgi:hypothetical protein
VIHNPVGWLRYPSRLRFIVPAILSIGLGGCQDPTVPDSREPGIHVLSAAGVVDTIQAFLPEPLTVRIVGMEGNPLSDVSVRFLGVISKTSSREGPTATFVGPHKLPLWETIERTDARGIARVGVQLGTFAGQAAVAISVPTMGYADTIRYVVRPGKASAVIGYPRDTTAYVGRGYVLRGEVYDRGGNPLPDAVTFSAEGPVSIADNMLIANALGRGRITAHSGALEDVIQVSVVPEGTVAFRAGRQLIVSNLDGSNFRSVAPWSPGNQTFGSSWIAVPGVEWSPIGRTLLAPYEKSILSVDVATGLEEAVFSSDFGPVAGARYSEDGNWLFFSAADAPKQSCSLFRASVDGLRLEQIGSPPTRYLCEFAPSPSRDGQRVAYTRTYGSSSEVVIHTVGTDSTTDIRLAGTHGAWGPIGDRIAYADTTRQMRVITPDGVVIHDLGNVGSDVNWIDWSPDGEWLLVNTRHQGVPVLIQVTTGIKMPIRWAVPVGEGAWRPAIN